MNSILEQEPLSHDEQLLHDAAIGFLSLLKTEKDQPLSELNGSIRKSSASSEELIQLAKSPLGEKILSLIEAASSLSGLGQNIYLFGVGSDSLLFGIQGFININDANYLLQQVDKGDRLPDYGFSIDEIKAELCQDAERIARQALSILAVRRNQSKEVHTEFVRELFELPF